MKGIRERKEETNTTHALPDPTSDWNTKISLLRQRKRRRSILLLFIWQKERVSFVSFDEATLFSFISHFFLVHFSSFFPFAAAPKDGEKEGWGREEGNRKGKIRKREEDRYNSCVPSLPPFPY